MLQRPLEIRAHHRIVDYDHGVWSKAPYAAGDRRDIDYLQERIRGTLQKYHSSLPSFEIRDYRGGVGGVDMVNSDAAVRLQVGKQTIRAPIQIVSGNDLVTGLQKPGNDIERGHA